MKAKPHDYEAFRAWLDENAKYPCERVDGDNVVGDPEGNAKARFLGIVLSKFSQAQDGVLGRICVCGEPATRALQIGPTKFDDKYCFCDKHAKVVTDYQTLVDEVQEETRYLKE